MSLIIHTPIPIVGNIAATAIHIFILIFPINGILFIFPFCIFAISNILERFNFNTILKLSGRRCGYSTSIPQRTMRLFSK